MPTRCWFRCGLRSPDDLERPAALAAVDAWAGASTAIDSDDTDAPALVARAVDALLGVSSGVTVLASRPRRLIKSDAPQPVRGPTS